MSSWVSPVWAHQCVAHQCVLTGRAQPGCPRLASRALLQGAFRGRWAAAGCIRGLLTWAKEQEPTCPLSQPPPALSVKCQRAREGGGETGKLLTRKMLGRGRGGLGLPDSYFGVCYDGAQPWQGGGLSVGALYGHPARREGEQVPASRGREGAGYKRGLISSSGHGHSLAPGYHGIL